MKRRRKERKTHMIGQVLSILLGAFIFAITLEKVLVPNDIIDGGITGISMMLAHMSSIPLGIIIFLLNLPFLVFGYKQIGKRFAISTLVAIGLMSVGTSLFHHSESFTQDPLLAAVFGGIGIGVGIGLVLRGGGSLDGTEITALVINKRVPFSVGEIVMFFNLFILGSAAFVFGPDNALYSLITYFVAYKTIDVVVEGFGTTRSVWIISNDYKEIGDTILDELGRGVTYMDGEGGYSGDCKKIIFCVINKLEENKLKMIVDGIDENAFVAVGHIHDVRGGRFKRKNIH